MHFVASIENELKMPEPVERIQYLDTKSTQRETSTRNTPVNYQTVETEPIENAKKKSFFSFGLDFLGDERESGSQSEAESGLDMYGVDDEYVPVVRSSNQNEELDDLDKIPNNCYFSILLPT